MNKFLIVFALILAAVMSMRIRNKMTDDCEDHIAEAKQYAEAAGIDPSTVTCEHAKQLLAANSGSRLQEHTCEELKAEAAEHGYSTDKTCDELNAMLASVSRIQMQMGALPTCQELQAEAGAEVDLHCS